MPHVYEQSTGKWYGPDGEIWGVGWAGLGAGRNNPPAQTVHDTGPLPVGWYTKGKAYHHDKLGPLTMDLFAYPENVMFGRSLFRIHGYGLDKERASEGCIIQEHPVRERINASPDDRVQVVAYVGRGV